MRNKISRLIHTALGHTQEEHLRQLNPLLRGWANYYRNGAAKTLFAALDNYVEHKLWRWITRRHPHKSAAGKKRKYFSVADGAFSVSYRTKKGESRRLTLYRMAATSIERHLKVKGEANPYDPNYTEYFGKRRCFAWRVRWGGRTTLQVQATPT